MGDVYGPAEPREMGLLFSFWYYRDVDFTAFLRGLSYRPAVFVDSGGFSAHTQGAHIDVKDYAAWVRRHRDSIDHYANLDVIGDARATLRNQLRMEAMGLRPLPVVHVGTDSQEIRAYAENGYTYQCLGGMVPHMNGASGALRGGRRDHKLLHWLDSCFEVGRACGVVFHGFGATAWDVVREYPWASIDSSTWTVGFRFGDLTVFEAGRHRWHRVGYRHTNAVMGHRALLQRFGIDPLALLRDNDAARSTAILVSVRSWVAAQRTLRRTRQFQMYLADPAGDVGAVVQGLGGTA